MTIKIITFKKGLGVCCILLALLCSCDSFVEVDQPQSQLTGTAVFEDFQTANASIADIYAKLRDRGLLSGTSAGISSQLGYYADELDYYGGAGNPVLAFYNNNILPSNSAIANHWNVSYNHIYAANAAIEGLTASQGIEAGQKNMLLGEAHFIRGLTHFYLANIFGDIPYITATDYMQNKSVPRLPVQQVYGLIAEDLEKASQLLPESYSNMERVRPNKFAANALLARTYLYMELWAEAADMASSVINHDALYAFEENLDNVFLKESTEAIWQFSPSMPGKNTDEGSVFIFISGPPPMGALTQELVNSFTPADLRLEHWIGMVSDGNSQWSHPFKYKQFNNTGTSIEYSIILRLTEQYLIRAEARARQGELIGAREDLQRSRQRAGLEELPALSQQQLIDAVMEERKLELFTEYGHRFFDLKRTGQLDTILSGLKPGWATTDILWPVPQSELQLNPNLLPQNPGY